MTLNSAIKQQTVNTASGEGIATITLGGEILDVWFPKLNLGHEIINCTVEENKVFKQIVDNGQEEKYRNVKLQTVSAKINLQLPPVDTVDAYLRLHLLSHRLVAPNTINLENIFAKLNNVVWTNYGPCSTENFEFTRLKLRTKGAVTVYSVDKFPRMVDYVSPSGVRIADADRVRLGAYLSAGTTVMHEGFVNFNAGTLGVSMVEGRISAGVTVGNGTDIGGGASIMGTLSGGGKEKIVLGERVLLGANSGVGISLGNDTVVEAGLYLTAGTKVNFLESATGKTSLVKAKQLSHLNNLLFRRNSVNGKVEALERKTAKLALNEQLHTN